MTTPDGYERIYLNGGKVAHLVSTCALTKAVSECRVWCFDGFWGTGSQDEYEKAAALPICRNCLKRIGEL